MKKLVLLLALIASPVLSQGLDPEAQEAHDYAVCTVLAPQLGKLDQDSASALAGDKADDTSGYFKKVLPNGADYKKLSTAYVFEARGRMLGMLSVLGMTNGVDATRAFAINQWDKLNCSEKLNLK